jgi:glucose-6-phosphate 1-dehydrogenase
MKLATRTLDLRYKAVFSQEIPDAYESLLLDVIRGEKGLFIRGDELGAAWDVFTPCLHEIDATKRAPEPYVNGSRGPAAATELAVRNGIDLR